MGLQWFAWLSPSMFRVVIRFNALWLIKNCTQVLAQKVLHIFYISRRGGNDWKEQNKTIHTIIKELQKELHKVLV